MVLGIAARNGIMLISITARVSEGVPFGRELNLQDAEDSHR